MGVPTAIGDARVLRRHRGALAGAIGLTNRPAPAGPVLHWPDHLYLLICAPVWLDVGAGLAMAHTGG